MTLRFRQPPTSGKALTAALAFIPLMLAASIIPIGVTFDGESRVAGFGIAIVLTLLLGAGLAAAIYRMMTPMTLAVGRDGVTLTDERNCRSRTLTWDEFTYSLIEGTGEWVLMLHHDRTTYVIKQHPVYAKSPPEFVEVCEAIEEKGRALV